MNTNALLESAKQQKRHQSLLASSSSQSAFVLAGNASSVYGDVNMRKLFAPLRGMTSQRHLTEQLVELTSIARPSQEMLDLQRRMRQIVDPSFSFKLSPAVAAALRAQAKPIWADAFAHLGKFDIPPGVLEISRQWARTHPIVDDRLDFLSGAGFDVAATREAAECFDAGVEEAEPELVVAAFEVLEEAEPPERLPPGPDPQLASIDATLLELLERQRREPSGWLVTGLSFMAVIGTFVFPVLGLHPDEISIDNRVIVAPKFHIEIDADDGPGKHRDD